MPRRVQWPHGLSPALRNNAARQRGAASAPFAFTYASVLDVESGQLANNDTVVMSGDRVAAVGLDARIPKGARIITARGTALIPELWAMHSHSLDRSEWSSLVNVANGVTGCRDPCAVKPTQKIVQLRRSVERGETSRATRATDGSAPSRAPFRSRCFGRSTSKRGGHSPIRVERTPKPALQLHQLTRPCS